MPSPKFICMALLLFSALEPLTAGALLINAQQASFRSRPEYVRDHFAHVETLPFDGLVFSTISGSALMNGLPRSYSQIAADFAPIRGLQFARMKHNFAWIDVDRPTDFFGDWSTTIDNFRSFARVLKECGIEGIFFDNEQYVRQLFNYPDDCSDPSKSLAQYQEQARRRGREITQAMAEEFPGIVLLALHGPYSSFAGTPDEVHRQQTDAETEEMRGAFSVGLVEGMSSIGRFVDGGAVYAYRTAEDFQLSYDFRKYTLGSEATDCPYIPRELRYVWPSKLHVAYGVYNRPFGGEDMDPLILRTTLERALARCDEYVWLYLEQGNWNAPGEVATEWNDAVVAAKAAASVPPGTAAPSVSITSPSTGSRFVSPGSIVITATASASEHSIAKAEFFAGATKLGEALAPPYQFVWLTPSAGAYVLTAKATDTTGAMTVSSGAEISVAETFAANINFQPADVTAPIHYFADTGEPYGSRNGLTYGWDVSHAEHVRIRRSSTDLRLDTLCQMQAGAVWEIAVPNGSYTVTVGIGDADSPSTYTINVEGFNYWSREQLAAEVYLNRTRTVEVTDGRLTIDGGDAESEETRLDYVIISAAGRVPIQPSNLIAVAAGPSAVDLQWSDNSSNEAGFFLQRSTVSSFTDAVDVAMMVTDVRSYRDTSVNGGQRYYYRIRAANENGSSSTSPLATVTTPWPDIDSDGIPDPLETGPFTVGVDDRQVDSDGDSVSNADEYRAGTDPSNGSSRFLITAMSFLRTDKTVTVCFPTIAGRDYYVDFSRSLTSGLWTLVPGAEFIASGSTQCVSDIVADDARFYRAHVLPPAGEAGTAAARPSER